MHREAKTFFAGSGPTSAPAIVLIVLLLALSACGGGGGSSSGSGTGGPGVVSVTVSPATASLFLGQTQAFTAQVVGTSDASVTWGVDGVTGGTAGNGTISAAGLYTAPQVLPSSTTVTVTAVTIASPGASASATVTLRSDVAVSVSPTSASVSPGASQSFAAGVSGSGNPSMAVTWSVNGAAGGNATVGTITAGNNNTATYVAPVNPPSPATVNVTATSVADPAKSASAAVTIACVQPNALSPSAASVTLGQSQVFTATLCISPGAPISWDVNGIPGGNFSIGTIVSTGGTTASYTAPLLPPPSNPVTINATSQTTPPQIAAATVTVVSNITVQVSPASATVPVTQRLTFTATVLNTSDAAVTWDVNGVPNGSLTLGQVCVQGSNPCVAPIGAVTGSVDYLAPAQVPAPPAVTLTATSHADPTRTGSASITIAAAAPPGITLAPTYAFLGPAGQGNSTLQFTAVVTGESSQTVLWSLASAVVGQGCTGADCGTISSSGLDSSPAAAPSPNGILVTATSQANPALTATATIAITSGPAIQTILPSSVLAGVVSDVVFAVDGVNFVAGSGAGASAIFLDGVPQPTTCPATTRCNAVLFPSQLALAGTFTIQVQNPGSLGALSNPVSFVVQPFTVGTDVISLSSSAPAAVGKDIIVVEPSTAGLTPAQINVDFAGPFINGVCTAQDSPITVIRPATGSEVVSICVHGNSLDPGFTYQFTGPLPSDITLVATSLGGLYPNLIQLDLTISSATQPGLRSLLITTVNSDTAVASGLLEVK
jgi:hypothetical protein